MMRRRRKCNPCNCGATNGEERKANALALLADRREGVVRRAQRALLTVLLEAGSATADDVRELVELPPGVGPKCFGAVPLPLARAGIIYREGYAPTSRPTAHARPLSVWRLADRNKALRWLADHSDLPDPADDDRAAGAQSFLFSIHPRNDAGAAVAAAAPVQEF
jgi:hypothetical protein